MTIEPREEFRKGPYVKGWNDLMASSQMSAAIMAAFSQMDFNMANPTTNEDAAANYYRKQGARTFIHILINLNESTPEKKPTMLGGQLNHTR